MPGRRARVRDVVLVLGIASGIWAIVVALTGGFVAFIGPVRLSSRDPRNASIISLVTLAAAVMLSTADERRRAVPRFRAWLFSRTPTIRQLMVHPPQTLAPVTAALAAVMVMAMAFSQGAFYAGGADVYGYVSQAGLWARGHVRVDQPLMRDPRWPYDPSLLAPLGYRATGDGALVPTYAPGLPLVMAVFERIGGRDAVFAAVPLLGGVAIWATYLLGKKFAGPGVGAAAAVLLASSPTFLFHVIFPMSDVPVTAWWTLALALLLMPGRAAAFAAGLSAGLAILTRPNLLPIGLVPGVFLMWRAVDNRSLTGAAAQRVLLFAAGAVPGCVTVALINSHLYGSPLVSGYGDLGQFYRWEHLLPNLKLYPAWLMQSQTPLMLLALVAPLLAARRIATGDSTRSVAVMWWCFTLVAWATLLCYLVFDTWLYLRLVLPVFPPLLVLTAFAATTVTARLPPALRAVGAAAFVGALVWHGYTFSYGQGLFVFREGERKYLAIGEYIARRLPENAALLSMQHSGSARYYSGRLTVRYDLTEPRQLEAVIETLRSLGYHPYFLLEDWERPIFSARFARHTPLAALDWPPRAWLTHSSKVFVFDPADRAAAAAGRTIRSDIAY